MLVNTVICFLSLLMLPATMLLNVYSALLNIILKKNTSDLF